MGFEVQRFGLPKDTTHTSNIKHLRSLKMHAARCDLKMYAARCDLWGLGLRVLSFQRLLHTRIV